MGRSLRRYLVLRLIYLLVVVAGALVLYWLIPREVWQTVRATYFSRNPGDFPP